MLCTFCRGTAEDVEILRGPRKCIGDLSLCSEKKKEGEVRGRGEGDQHSLSLNRLTYPRTD